jgi:hypothetical protein
MAWEHAVDDERGTFGREMYEVEKAAKDLGPKGAALLASLDQVTAEYRHRMTAVLYGPEPKYEESNMTRTFRFPDNHPRGGDVFTMNDTAVAVDDMYTRWRLMPDPTGAADLLLHDPRPVRQAREEQA